MSTKLSNNKKKELLIAFVEGEESIKAVKDYAAANGMGGALIQSGNIKNATEHLKGKPSPVYLIADLPSKETASADIDALADVCEAGVKLILTGAIDELKFYQTLMAMGVTDYILKPIEQNELERAFNKTKEKKAAEEKNEPGKVVSVIGARGGVGASTFALGLGLAIGTDQSRKCALVDLDPQFSTLSLSLDLEPSRGFREALEKPDRIDSLFMERVLIKQSPFLSLLSAEEAIESEPKISENAFDTLFAEIVQKYRFVVFDVPRNMKKICQQAFMKSDYIILVAEPTIASVRDGLRITELAARLNPKAEIMVALNKVGLNKKFEMPAGNFSKNVKREIAMQVPFLPDIAGFENAGKPLSEIGGKQSKLQDGIISLATKIAGADESQADSSSSKSVLGGLSFKKFMK